MRGKCTQRNFWIGESMVDIAFGSTFPTGSEETQAVLQGEESVATGLLVFDGEAHEVLRWLSVSSSSSLRGSYRRHDAVLA